MWQYRYCWSWSRSKKKTGGAGAEAVINKVRLRNTAMNSNPRKQRTTSDVMDQDPYSIYVRQSSGSRSWYILS